MDIQKIHKILKDQDYDSMVHQSNASQNSIFFFWGKGNFFGKAQSSIFLISKFEISASRCDNYGCFSGFTLEGKCSTSASFSQDREPFASYESLEQLHRFLFVLGVTHVSYSFLAIALAMIKVYISSSNLPLLAHAVLLHPACSRLAVLNADL